MLKPRKISTFFLLIAYLVVLFGCFCTPISARVHSETLAKNNTQTPYTESISTAKKGFWNLSDVDITKVNPNRKLIALTFDDSPDKTLEKIIAVFLGHNSAHPDAPATATIFCNGCRIHSPVDTVLHTAVTAGFELGNHTQNHKKLTTLCPAELQQEIDKTDKRLSRYDGKIRHLFRPPYGELNPESRPLIPTPIISWYIDTLDWTGISAEQIYETVWKNKFSGAIVLMHDGYENTVTALKRLLPDLY